MPRYARVKTNTKTYHIMMRGINKQVIFHDNVDRYKFLKILKNYKDECGFALFAYCLMDNHIHLLLQESDTPLEIVFKKINTSYAIYFNYKYSRVGHLFQDRFRSEAITSDPQLMQTARYIHRNPLKAGICDHPDEFRFSSYKEYIGTENSPICDTSFLLDMFGSVGHFKNYTEEDMPFECLEPEDNIRTKLSNEEALTTFLSLFPKGTPSYFKALKRQERDKSIIELRIKKLTLQQISTFTGISISTLSRIIKDNSK